ncbi:hypothetical protein LCX93_07160 [Sulfurimonas sp. SWIR-19]|uniref:hypothetical protein n=1 Tax=Sulfurimonas sp. SWIR-19 TaxID=2878390 RepID=UPI001CF205C3|nr:hypothetical protein [Sulfurimonas sp. SWIR-19]UCM99316.1 hypothetical protein LCX93_07160 [Sulfurimonas sp. SWIR-19]
MEIIKKIKEDIDSIPNEDMSQKDKNRLKSLQTKLFNNLIKQYEINSQKEDLIAETKEILDRVLNSASHHSDNPLHRQELKDAINHMTILKELLENETN